MLLNSYNTANNTSNKIGYDKQQQEAISSPWLNLNYDDIEEKIWKELPHLEGCYFISNFGRIKSLDRVIESKNGKNHNPFL